MELKKKEKKKLSDILQPVIVECVTKGYLDMKKDTIKSFDYAVITLMHRVEVEGMSMSEALNHFIPDLLRRKSEYGK